MHFRYLIAWWFFRYLFFRLLFQRFGSTVLCVVSLKAIYNTHRPTTTRRMKERIGYELWQWKEKKSRARNDRFFSPMPFLLCISRRLLLLGSFSTCFFFFSSLFHFESRLLDLRRMDEEMMLRRRKKALFLCLVGYVCPIKCAAFFPSAAAHETSIDSRLREKYRISLEIDLSPASLFNRREEASAEKILKC